MPHYLIRATGEVGAVGAPQIREYLIKANDQNEARDIATDKMIFDEGLDVIRILSVREEVRA